MAKLIIALNLCFFVLLMGCKHKGEVLCMSTSMADYEGALIRNPAQFLHHVEIGKGAIVRNSQDNTYRLIKKVDENCIGDTVDITQTLRLVELATTPTKEGIGYCEMTFPPNAIKPFDDTIERFTFAGLRQVTSAGVGNVVIIRANETCATMGLVQSVLEPNKNVKEKYSAP
jgi:hypothetical protein